MDFFSSPFILKAISKCKGIQREGWCICCFGKLTKSPFTFLKSLDSTDVKEFVSTVWASPKKLKAGLKYVDGEPRCMYCSTSLKNISSSFSTKLKNDKCRWKCYRKQFRDAELEQESVLVFQRAQSFSAVLLNIVLSHGIKGLLPSTNPSMKDTHQGHSLFSFLI